MPSRRPTRETPAKDTDPDRLCTPVESPGIWLLQAGTIYESEPPK
jgi:hypothetical protein